eukprot:CAMPEP_0172298606 /NCGR_PEP_ID=MMETSP1058-20130122/1183_1 /TAXON_ID=83371 /ORGANISM="Detonula confervacea, Strain CCMP 353" /LENGTH=430 /DNA_ID=CAMNT_0013007887 /DNA_START=358 /DNA_END=1650 /DNA_ORIENTATION=-
MTAKEEAIQADPLPPPLQEDGHKNKENNNAKQPHNLYKNESLESVDYNDLNFDIPLGPSNDPNDIRNRDIIANSTPSSQLELALKAELDRQLLHNEVLAGECTKLRGFIAKRKQTYKRKRKDESAPRKKLSGYNLFVRERFAKLAKQNEDALKSADSGAELKRVPPASNIASSGHAWSQLTAEEKSRYNEMAKPDGDRYQKESATYQAPDRQSNRKRAKTGYNIFFSQHVLMLKSDQGEGVPSERGSVARVVGDAWKKMTAEEKDEFEQQADRQNEIDPVEQRQPLEMTAQAPLPPQIMPEHQQHEQHMQHPPPPPPMGDMNDGALGPPVDPMDPNAMHPPHMGGPGMPPPMYPPDGYGGGGYPGGPPPPIIHHPPGYDPGYYGAPPPPYDPYAYPPPYPPQGMPPLGAEGMPYGPPPPNYQGHPPPPYV